MKKWIALCLALMLFLTACGKTTPAPEAPAQTTQVATEAAPEATEPAMEVTEPATEATEPATEATEPATEATTEATEPATEETEAPTEETQTAEGTITPLMYEVTDSQGHKIWLFGSIHVGLEYFYPLPEYVTEAFSQAEGLAVEFDMRAFSEDMAAQVAAMQCLIYTDGTTIKDHISEDLYNRTVAILKDGGVYNAMLDYYMPVMWFSLVENIAMEKAGMDANLGIDINLINMAYDAEMPVLSIESAESQYAMLASFSPELQSILLESTVAAYEEGLLSSETEILLNAWAEGNLAQIQELLASPDASEFESEEEFALYAQYEDAMMTQRDNLMAEYCKTALTEGKQILVCVGTAHVVGNHAILAQLEEAGFTVTQILPE